MFNIPYYMNKDEYLQIPMLRTFCKEHRLKTTENKPELLNSICDFANEDEDNRMKVIEWFSPKLKEDSKEFCYKKLYDINPILHNKDIVKQKIKDKYPDCLQETLFTCKNEKEPKCINYEIITNDNSGVEKISFVFTRLVLEGERGEDGDVTVYPVFIDIYLKDGFIVGRGKAKSTLFKYAEDKVLYKDNHIDTKGYMLELMDEIIKLFELNVETNPRKLKDQNSQMLYNLFDKYSFTPDIVQKNINSVENISSQYCMDIFNKLGLSIANAEKAKVDLRIFVEKYVSINGNNENIFKEDRDAYLVRMSSDDVQDTTRIDTASSKEVPLQCTEAFFDSKKSIINNKKCRKINLCFKRKNRKYYGNKPFIVQFSTVKNCGVFKIAYYAEEVDIQNVLQTIFENY